MFKSRKLLECLCTEMTQAEIRLTMWEKRRDQGERNNRRFGDQVYGQHKTIVFSAKEGPYSVYMPLKARLWWHLVIALFVCQFMCVWVRPSNHTLSRAFFLWNMLNYIYMFIYWYSSGKFGHTYRDLYYIKIGSATLHFVLTVKQKSAINSKIQT